MGKAPHHQQIPKVSTKGVFRSDNIKREIICNSIKFPLSDKINTIYQ